MSYYKIIDGKKYDRALLDAVKASVEGRGDGRISREDAELVLKHVRDGNAYTDVEKNTVEYVRENYKWTDAADAWFRAEISKWAGDKAAKTRAANAAAKPADAATA